MAELGTLWAKIKLDSTEFSKGVDKVTSALSGLTTASAAAGAAIAGLFAAATAEGLRFAAQLEQLQMGFTTLLGSGGAADDFIRSMQDFAARTPFQFEDVAQGARRLMAMGIEAEHTLPLLSAIGDRVSAMGGGAAEVNRVITALGQMNAKTRVATQEINQLTEVGISGFGLLAKELGKTVPEVIAMVEAREVDSATFLKAFMHTTANEVGGMMERQSTTLIGLVSTLKDRVSIGLADAAKPMIEPLKQAIPEVTAFVGNVIAAVGPLISGLGEVVTAGSKAIAWFNALDAATQKAVLGFGVLGATLPAMVGGVAALASGVAAAIAALAPYGPMLATALSPEVVLPLIAALSALQAIAGDVWGAFSLDGEGAMDTVKRLATTMMGVLGPAADYLGAVFEAFLGGFRVGWMEMYADFSYLGVGLLQLTDLVLQFIETITGTDFGAEKWAAVGEAVGWVTKKVVMFVGDGLAVALDYVTMLASAFLPMVAAIGEFADGLLGLVTGSYDAGTAFEKMTMGIIWTMVATAAAVGQIVGGLVASVADALAGLLDVTPGMGGIAGTLKSAGADIRSEMSSFANNLMYDIAGGTINMEAEANAAAGSVAEFSMITDAAATSTTDYANALDGLVGVLSGAQGKASKAKTEKAAKVKEYDPFSDTAAAFGMTGDELSNRIEELLPKPTKAVEYDPLADTAAAFGMTVEEFTARTEELDKATKDRIEAEKDAIDAMKAFRAAMTDKLLGGLGKLQETINSAVSGFQSGGVWGALIAVLVELLVSSETMANISKTLDDVFGQISDAFGQLLVGVHLVVGNMLLLVAQLVNGLAPLFEFVSDIFAGIAPLLIVLGVVVGTFADLLSVILAPLEGVMGILSLVFEGLFLLLKGVAQVIMVAMLGIQQIWNGILDALIWVLGGLSKIFGGLDEVIAKMEGMKADTDATSAALNDLSNMTYDAAMAQAEQNVTVQETTESLNAMNAALVNVPSGYKVALARFAAMSEGRWGSSMIADLQIPAMASGGVTLGPTLALVGERGPEAVIPLDRLSEFGGGGGRGAAIVITGDVYVSADDPETFMNQLERVAAKRNFQRTGSTIASRNGFSVGRR